MKPSVLVVDDFEPIQNLYVDVLVRCSFKTLRAPSGEDALRIIYTERPDVVLLDIDLPRMSGLDVLQHIRQSENIKDTRVIVITGNHIVEHTDNISDADLVLIKPVSPIDIVNFVNRLMPA